MEQLQNEADDGLTARQQQLQQWSEELAAAENALLTQQSEKEAQWEKQRY